MPPALLFFKKIHAEICHYQLAHNDDDEDDKSETTTSYAYAKANQEDRASWWIVGRVQAWNFACRNFTKNLALPNH